jgi:uncharacterized LabA/DUF88 family protein
MGGRMAEKNLYLFVDNSNVLLEARRFAEMNRARSGRLSPYMDNSYELDWGKFLHLTKKNDSRLLAQVPTLYGSRPPPQDSVWERIRNEGFDVRLFDRNIRNKEKGVDMEMGMDVVETVLTIRPPRTIAIAAGDADFLPVINRAKAKEWRVEVWFWSNAAADVKKAAHEFVPLDKYLQYLRLGGGIALPP